MSRLYNDQDILSISKPCSIQYKKPLIMGILNITKDSFSDGNKFTDIDAATQHANKMVNEGAAIIDIGGESTRPQANAVDVDEEIKRVLPVISILRNSRQFKSKTENTESSFHTENADTSLIHKTSHNTNKPLISVDTYKSQVAKEAIKAGADIINDIYALRYDGSMVNVLKDFPHSKIILMHMQGTPNTMQLNPKYENVIKEILDFFKERIDYCLSNGISENRIIIDPGIGFGKTFEHNIIILKEIERFHCFNLPILLGASRKSFINHIYYSSPQERLVGSLASSVIACLKKIDIVRVHDVKEHRDLINSLFWMLK